MSKDQEFNNRSQGQRIRRSRELTREVIDAVVDTAALTAQNTRDIAVIKARVTDLERTRDRADR